jgi:hypothetical protein
MVALLARPGTTLSRSELERQICGWNEEVESNAIEFLIHIVSRKLGSASLRPGKPAPPAPTGAPSSVSVRSASSRTAGVTISKLRDRSFCGWRRLDHSLLLNDLGPRNRHGHETERESGRIEH